MQLILKTLVYVVLKNDLLFMCIFTVQQSHFPKLLLFRLFIPSMQSFLLKMKSRIQKPLTIISNSPHLKPRVGFQPTTLSNSFAGQ